MEVPSAEFYMKVGFSLAALKELKSDKNYTNLGQSASDKLTFVQDFLLDVAEASVPDPRDDAGRWPEKAQEGLDLMRESWHETEAERRLLDVAQLLEALRFIEYGCEEILDEYVIAPGLRDIIDEFRLYATIRKEYQDDA